MDRGVSNNESGRYVLSSFSGHFLMLCSGYCPKDKQSCGDGTTATVLARATYFEGVKNVSAGCNPMDFCRGSQNLCRPRRRIILLDRSPLEPCFRSTEWVAATTSDLRTLTADTAASATSSLASSLAPLATSLNLGTPTIPPVYTPPLTSFMNSAVSGSVLSSCQVNRRDTHPEP